MSMYIYMFLSSFHVIFLEASHWPSGHMIRLSFTMASVHTVVHNGISTLKMKIYIGKCTSLRLVISPPWLSFTMASVPAVLHNGISTLKMKIYIKKCTSLGLIIFPPFPRLSFTMASVPAVLHNGISTLIQNPWGKVMERSGLRFEHFCLEVV